MLSKHTNNMSVSRLWYLATSGMCYIHFLIYQQLSERFEKPGSFYSYFSGYNYTLRFAFIPWSRIVLAYGFIGFDHLVQTCT